MFDRFLIDFWSILEPTWPPKPLQNRPKIDQKSIKNRNKSLINFLIDFWWLWDRFLVDLASKLEGRGTKKHWKTNGFWAFLLFQPTCQQEATWSIFWSAWCPTWRPKLSKIPPKRPPKSIKNRTKNKSKNGVHFGPIFVRFSSILASMLAPKRGGRRGGERTFGGLVGSWGQDGPKSRKRGPKTPPRSPKWLPRGPQEPFLREFWSPTWSIWAPIWFRFLGCLLFCCFVAGCLTQQSQARWRNGPKGS